MSILDGSNFKLFYNSTPISDATDAAIKGASWTEAVNVAGVTRGNTRSQNDFQARSGVVTTTGPAKRSLRFTVAYDTDDAFYTALEAAADGNTPIALAACDGAIATEDTKGSVGNFLVVDFSLEEPESGPAVVSVEAALTSFANWGYVAPGA